MEITRSLATRRAIRNTPASSRSRSWPSTVASNAPGLPHRLVQHPDPSSTSSNAGAVPGQRIDQLHPRGRIVVVAHRLPRGGVVVVAGQHRPQLRRAKSASAAASRPRIADRTNVTVSIVATAS